MAFLAVSLALLLAEEPQELREGLATAAVEVLAVLLLVEVAVVEEGR
jgi:hypothetical protein